MLNSKYEWLFLYVGNFSKLKENELIQKILILLVF